MVRMRFDFITSVNYEYMTDCLVFQFEQLAGSSGPKEFWPVHSYSSCRILPSSSIFWDSVRLAIEVCSCFPFLK